MSITFACPECMVQIEVADEHAGESGECPRCKQVIVIPSPHQPAPVLMGAKVVPMPAADPWDKPAKDTPSKPRRAETDEPAARRTRTTAAPKQPAGPIWPWVLGVFMAFVVVVLLFSSFAVLVFWRRAEPTRPAPAAELKVKKQAIDNPAMIGRLEGQRIVMQDGVFQIRTELNANDEKDPRDGINRCKRFEIQLRRNQVYVFEQTSNQFDCVIRLENNQNGIQMDVGQVGVRNAAMEFQAPQDGIFVVYATCAQQGFGNFTLTIRERNQFNKFP